MVESTRDYSIYKVQVETGWHSDQWLNADVTGDETEARRHFESRSNKTRGVQRVQLKRNDQVIARSDGSLPA